MAMRPTSLTNMTFRNLSGWVTGVVVLCLTGCSPLNPQLMRADSMAGYRYENLTETSLQKNSDKNFVVLTFSGGGTRAAAFEYGVLEELRATTIDGGSTILEEVDVI